MQPFYAIIFGNSINLTIFVVMIDSLNGENGRLPEGVTKVGPKRFVVRVYNNSSKQLATIKLVKTSKEAYKLYEENKDNYYKKRF